MINIKELRIGNLVNFMWHSLQILSLMGYATIQNGIITIKYKLALINEFGEVCEMVYEDDKNINYIKLTNEILEKWCGFEKIDVDYFKLKTENFYCNIDEQGFGFALEHDNFYICEHVHQLQNLYFALMGKEITINV